MFLVLFVRATCVIKFISRIVYKPLVGIFTNFSTQKKEKKGDNARLPHRVTPTLLLDSI